MEQHIKYVLSGFVLVTLCIACDSGPKVIKSREKEVKAELTSEFHFNWSEETFSSPKPNSFYELVHQVEVKEILPAKRYTYLKVIEKGEEIWIATRKGSFEEGSKYFYRNGLLKRNFHSKEYDRTFDRIYLVSQLVPEKHGGNQLSSPKHQAVQIETHSSTPAAHSFTKKGLSISIAELIGDPARFEGQVIELSGRCVKVNPNIMQRNWIHLKDGTADHFDLVVTTKSQVNEGDPVHLRAKVVLNKDFGAGYTYDLILEEGIIL